MNPKNFKHDGFECIPLFNRPSRVPVPCCYEIALEQRHALHFFAQFPLRCSELDLTPNTLAKPHHTKHKVITRVMMQVCFARCGTELWDNLAIIMQRIMATCGQIIGASACQSDGV